MKDARGRAKSKHGRELFRAWLEKNGLKPADAARGIGVSKAAVSQWLNDVEPSERMRELIAVYTGGEVPGSSWGPLVDRRKKKKQVVPFVPEARG